MAIIKPFKALKPGKEIAEKLASRPYDVLNSQEAKKEAAGNDYSFLRITKSEIDLPEGISPAFSSRGNRRDPSKTPIDQTLLQTHHGDF